MCPKWSGWSQGHPEVAFVYIIRLSSGQIQNYSHRHTNTTLAEVFSTGDSIHSGPVWSIIHPTMEQSPDPSLGTL